MEEGIRLIMSFLGGGVVAGLLGWLRANRADRIARRIGSLKDQVRLLYGPLHFFSALNESYFELNDKIQEAYTAEFVEKRWSENESTQRSIREQATRTLDLANEYARLVVANNDRILDLLRDNFAYIDTDDIEIFRQFMVDYTRMRTEMGEQSEFRPPFSIYKRIGEISFMRPEFIERVEAKFREKREILASYE